jgi:hypothetical protein
MGSVVRARSIIALVVACGCRMGLPPEPPEHDATNADAGVPAYEPTTNVFETSAFEGVKLQGGGHDHHGHGGHGAKKAPPQGDRAAPDAKPPPDPGHEGHGAAADPSKAEPSKAEKDATPPATESPKEPKREGSR